MITTKMKETYRVKDETGTYNVELEEVSRTRIFPEEEVIEIISQAIYKGKLDIDENPDKYVRLFNIYHEMARIAWKDINERFAVSIKVKKIDDTRKRIKDGYKTALKEYKKRKIVEL